MSYLDAILSSQGGSADHVRLAEPAVVTPPSDGARLFYDADVGLALRHADGQLRSLRPDPTDVYVSDCVPPGDTFLTPYNFDTALRAAIAKSLSYPKPPNIRIPAGDWMMSAASVYMVGRGYTPMPYFIGQGRDNTILRWPDTFSGACFEFDGEAGDSLYFGGGLIGLSVRSADGNYDGRAVGLKYNGWILGVLRDVNIGGFGNRSNDGWEHGVGIWARGNVGTIENSQNIAWDNVCVMQCTTGGRLSATTQYVWNHVQWNQHRGFCDLALAGGCQVVMNGGMFQSAGDDATSNTYFGHEFYCIRTIGGVTSGVGNADDYFAAGNAASLSAPSGGKVTVTGLTGMTANSVGHWLYFRDAVGAGNQGIFEITDYVSATSVKIAKVNGNVDPHNGALRWEEQAAAGGTSLTVNGFCYHEGVIAGVVKTHKPNNGGHAFSFTRFYPANALTFANLDGCNDFVINSLDAWPDGVLIKARRSSIAVHGVTDALSRTEDMSNYDLDVHSLEGLRINGRSALSQARASITDILRRTAAEIMDLKDTTRVTLSGGYVDAISCLLGTTINAPSAGERMVWIPSHPRMGGYPAIGLRRANNRRGVATLATPIPSGSYVGIFAIMHLPSGYSLPGTASARGPILQSTDEVKGIRLTLDCGDGPADGAIGFLPADGGTAGPTLTLTGRKTVAVLLQPTAAGADLAFLYPSIYINSFENGYQYGASSDRTDRAFSKVYLSGLPGHGYQSEDIDIAYLAFLKQPLITEEIKALMGAAQPYLVDVSRAPAPVRTGSFTVDSVADARVRVDISSANAVPTLPPGRAGDKVLVKVVSAASGHTCTITATGELIDNASTLALSTDRAWAQLEHDGSGWLITSKG